MAINLRHVHVVGVCGTLMGAFACFLKRQGIRVTGSDQNMYPPMSDVLQTAGVELLSPYAASNIGVGSDRPELIVIGNVIRSDNAEAVAARASGISVTSLPEFMEQWLLPKTRNLVIAGTHGKTTTSSMLAFVLHRLNQHPSYFVGGVGHDLPHSFHVSEQSRYFVLEGDEYDTVYWDKVPKFFHYLPDDAVLTSVEFDHADIYADLEAVIRAFEGLIDRIRPGGRLILCADFPTFDRMHAYAHTRAKTKKDLNLVTYGLSKKAYWRAEHIQSMDVGGRAFTGFDVLRDGKKVASLKIQLPGAHNVVNALSVWIECDALGLAPDQVAQALADFKGVKRRQEIRGEKRGITVIDDFAHHPTAVRETIAALKSRYKDRRLVVVFEPRSATSRRKVFQQAYVEAFAEADAVWIAKPYDQSRISADDQFSSDALISDLNKPHRTARAAGFDTVDQGVESVRAMVQPGDVVAILSNGGFGGFIGKLLDRL